MAPRPHPAKEAHGQFKLKNARIWPQWTLGSTPLKDSRQFWTYQRGVFYLALKMHNFFIFSDRLLTNSHAMYLVSNKVTLN